jgi:FAD:protein FMN transferase
VRGVGVRLIGATPYWSVIEGRGMGSRWRAVLGDAPDGLTGWVGDELARLERCWSRFDASSELRTVERAAAGRWAAISPTLALAVDRSLRLARATAGAFDPAVGSCMAAIGYDRTFSAVERDAPHAVRPQPSPGAAGVELDPGGPALRLRPGTCLDLGGLGKGLAADLVVEGALDRGARSCCAGVGGDVRVGGVAPPGGWVIPLADPAGSADRAVAIDAGALVTSTTAIRTWRRAGRCLHHIVDPSTGVPASTGVRAVIASAADAWWAEGVAKAALVVGRDRGAQLMSRCGVDGWIVADDGSWTTVGDRR